MKLIREIPCKQSPGKLKFSDDGSQILSFDRDSIISYKTNGDATIIPIEPFVVVFDVAYINETEILAVGVALERGHGIIIYDIKAHRVIQHIDSEYLMSVCTDKSSKRIFAGASEKAVYIYDFALSPQGIIASDFVSPISSISYAMNKLAIAGVFIEVWDLSNKPYILTEECPTSSDCTGNPCEANLIDISLDGRIAVAGFHGAQGTCVALDGQTGKVIRWFGPKGDEMNFYGAGVLSVSRDGQYLATGLVGTASIAFYEISTGIITHKYKNQTVCDIAFSPTDDIIAIGTENAIILWEYDG